jgi:6,7-dimethyl-8-ribityllumazine synthase
MLRKLKSSRQAPSLQKAAGLRFAIVCAEYNPEFTEPLLQAAERELRGAGARRKNIFVIRVPGSFEIPVVAAWLARSRKYDAILALGVVFQGKTLHAQHILEAVAILLQKVAVETGIPIIHQVLSPASRADARKRTWPGPYHRGVEAARTAVRMALLKRQGLKKGRK